MLTHLIRSRTYDEICYHKVGTKTNKSLQGCLIFLSPTAFQIEALNCFGRQSFKYSRRISDHFENKKWHSHPMVN